LHGQQEWQAQEATTHGNSYLQTRQMILSVKTILCIVKNYGEE
jgi:hypothetical protein